MYTMLLDITNERLTFLTCLTLDSCIFSHLLPTWSLSSVLNIWPHQHLVSCLASLWSSLVASLLLQALISLISHIHKFKSVESSSKCHSNNLVVLSVSNFHPLQCWMLTHSDVQSSVWHPSGKPSLSSSVLEVSILCPLVSCLTVSINMVRTRAHPELLDSSESSTKCPCPPYERFLI
jgi:hypothetical protein